MAQRESPEGDANLSSVQQTQRFTLEKLIMLETESYGVQTYKSSQKEVGEGRGFGDN